MPEYKYGITLPDLDTLSLSSFTRDRLKDTDTVSWQDALPLEVFLQGKNAEHLIVVSYHTCTKECDPKSMPDLCGDGHAYVEFDDIPDDFKQAFFAAIAWLGTSTGRSYLERLRDRTEEVREIRRAEVRARINRSPNH